MTDIETSHSKVLVAFAVRLTKMRLILWILDLEVNFTGGTSMNLVFILMIKQTLKPILILIVSRLITHKVRLNVTRYFINWTGWWFIFLHVIYPLTFDYMEPLLVRSCVSSFLWTPVFILSSTLIPAEFILIRDVHLLSLILHMIC